MEDLVIFIVQNQDFVWYMGAFLVFVYFSKFFIKLILLTFSIRKAFKITGKIK